MDILANLNDAQRQAVMHVDGPLLVLAGAGSGKTRVITRRVAYLTDQGIAPWNILAITFTNKAAGEMRDRVSAVGATRGATVCTFHSLCARLLRTYAGEAALAPNFSIYDRDDQIRAVKEAMKTAELSTDRMSPTAVLATISNAKNDMQTAEEYAQMAADFFARNVSRVFTEYEKVLAGNNALDFDDLLTQVAFLLRDRPEVRQQLGQQYKYVLIDEYQDTNRAQYIIAHGIAMDHENICATGDPDQSIYAWRGADIRNILEFEADYPNAIVVRLEENYRSTTPILTTAGSLIANNSSRKDKRLWTRREGGAPVAILYCDDEHAEARLIVEKIAERVAGGGSHDDVAVFYRVNSLSRVVEEALIRAGVPYRIARGVEFYNRKEIKDVLAYLRALVNPADDLSCRRVINTPRRGIGDTTINRLAELAARTGGSLLTACRTPEAAGLKAGAAKKVSDFAVLMDQLAGEIERPVREILEEVVLRTGLEDLYRWADDADSDAWANIAELISTAAEFDAGYEAPETEDAPPPLVDYLQQVSLISDADHFAGSGAVTLMTLHAAKGLEFPHVYMIGCEQGLLPFERMGESQVISASGVDEKLEEERRLAFVGMTRAQDDLTLSCVRTRMIRGRTTPQSSSPFLREIGTEGVIVVDKTTPPEAKPQRRRKSSVSRGGFFEDVEERAMIEAIADQADMSAAHHAADEDPPPAEYEYLKVGCTVQHATFGVGKVAKLSLPWPKTKAVIDFHEVGRKTLVLKLAKLELL